MCVSEIENLVHELMSLPDKEAPELSVDSARKVVLTLNRFLYTTHEGIGTVRALGDDYPYFSDFHKYWDRHYREILDIRIDNEACALVAKKLHEVHVRTGGKAFSSVYSTCGLKPEDICRIRLLTANQDFGTSLKFETLAAVYKKKPNVFDVVWVHDNPEAFLTELRLNRLSQNDKRITYAKTISGFLIEHKASPAEIAERFGNDARKLRDALIGCVGAGYGNKKADMLIRDMYVLGVWKNISHFDSINVASDSNTMRVALRTGIVKSAMPLVSSFLDYFGLQYGAVDDAAAKAWRRVWELWTEMYPDDAPEGPSLLDYFVYNVVGRQYCKDILVEYKCQSFGHTFLHKSGLRKCRVCQRRGVSSDVVAVNRMLPCLSPEGHLVIEYTGFYKSGIAKPNYETCPFVEICKLHDGQRLMPPRAISILGRTGWKEAYVDSDAGGGGLSS